MGDNEIFGTLFKTVPLYSEEHLEMIIETMDSEQANYLAVQALVHSFNSGVFTLGESEIVSKIVRTLSKKTPPINEKGGETPTS
jgi:hypothetical protein